MSQTISSYGTCVVLAVQCHLSFSFPKEEIIGVFPVFAIHSDFWRFFLGLDKGCLVLIAFVVLKEWSLSFAIWFHVCGSDGLLSSSSLHQQLSKHVLFSVFWGVCVYTDSGWRVFFFSLRKKKTKFFCLARNCWAPYGSLEVTVTPELIILDLPVQNCGCSILCPIGSSLIEPSFND